VPRLRNSGLRVIASSIASFVPMDDEASRKRMMAAQERAEQRAVRRGKRPATHVDLASDKMTPEERAEWIRADREAELLELAMDAQAAENSWATAAIENGWPLADFECKHGRLPSDRTPPCGCWPEESSELVKDLMGVIEQVKDQIAPHMKTQHKTLYACTTIECKTVMFTGPAESEAVCPTCKAPGSKLRGPIPAAK
jgi:hypothetical protein